MIVGESVTNGLCVSEATAVKREETNRLAPLVDDRHFDVIVCAGGGGGELGMEIRACQVRIAFSQGLPLGAALCRQLRSCDDFDIHLPTA
jgi:hypothetical protein